MFTRCWLERYSKQLSPGSSAWLAVCLGVRAESGPTEGVFFSDLVTTAWEVISAWEGQDRKYAVLDLLSAIRCRMRRQFIEKDNGKELPLGPELEDNVVADSSFGRTALDELAYAIEEHVGRGLDPVDGAVLYGVRVLGLTTADLARMSGRSRRYLSGGTIWAEAYLRA